MITHVISHLVRDIKSINTPIFDTELAFKHRFMTWMRAFLTLIEKTIPPSIIGTNTEIIWYENFGEKTIGFLHEFYEVNTKFTLHLFISN